MLEGGDMSRVNGRNGMGECSYVFIKMEKFKKSKVVSTGLPRDELFACGKWKSIY